MLFSRRMPKPGVARGSSFVLVSAIAKPFSTLLPRSKWLTSPKGIYRVSALAVCCIQLKPFFISESGNRDAKSDMSDPGGRLGPTVRLFSFNQDASGTMFSCRIYSWGGEVMQTCAILVYLWSHAKKTRFCLSCPMACTTILTRRYALLCVAFPMAPV